MRAVFLFAMLGALMVWGEEEVLPGLRPFTDPMTHTLSRPASTRTQTTASASTSSTSVGRKKGSLKELGVAPENEAKRLKPGIQDRVLPHGPDSPGASSLAETGKQEGPAATTEPLATLTTTQQSSSAGIVMPQGLEMRPVLPTQLDPNHAKGHNGEEDDAWVEGYLTATRASHFLGPNGLASEVSEVVRMPASLRAFKSCIYGCSSVTIPASTGGSTVVVVLPFTIPCSLVSCPPCTTCVSSTVSITVCPVVSTVVPPPVKATVFTFNPITTPTATSCPLAAPVATTTDTVTVTRTRMPVGCPALRQDYLKDDGRDRPFSYQIDNGPESMCSTFVVCTPRHFICPACHLGQSVDLGSVMSALDGDSSTLSPVLTLSVPSKAEQHAEAAQQKISSTLLNGSTSPASCALILTVSLVLSAAILSIAF